MKIGDNVTIDGADGVIIAIGNAAGPDNVSVRMGAEKVWLKADRVVVSDGVEDKAVEHKAKGKRSR